MLVSTLFYIVKEAFEGYPTKPERQWSGTAGDSLSVGQTSAVVTGLPAEAFPLLPYGIVMFGDRLLYRVIRTADADTGVITWQTPLTSVEATVGKVAATFSTGPLAGAAFHVGGGPSNATRRVSMSVVGMGEVPLGIGRGAGSFEQNTSAILWVEVPLPKPEEAEKNPVLKSEAHARFLQMTDQVIDVLHEGTILSICRRIMTPTVTFELDQSERVWTYRARVDMVLTDQV
jgi:hypothetical protein